MDRTLVFNEKLYHRTLNMQHVEQHFSGSDTVHDVVIGMTDGLPVPFALAAGKREDESWFIEVRRNRPFDSETD